MERTRVEYIDAENDERFQPATVGQVSGLASEAGATHLLADRYETTSTQPLDRSFHHRTIAVQTRPKTFQTTAASSHEHDFAMQTILNPNPDAFQLRRQVFDIIKRRLQLYNSEIHDLDERFFAFLLPKHDAKPADWSRLLNQPFLVSNEALNTMLHLKSAQIVDSRTDVTINTTYYFRTYTLTVSQVSTILQTISQERGQTLEQKKASEMSESIKDLLSSHPNQKIFIRYCGMTTERSAWIRHT